MVKKIIAWVVEEPQVIRDLDFDETQYLTNFEDRAIGIGRVVVGLDTGPRLVVICCYRSWVHFYFLYVLIFNFQLSWRLFHK